MSGTTAHVNTPLRIASAAMLAALLLGGPSRATDIDLQSVPPYILQGVHPNLILTIDNSGVMPNAYMPAELHGGDPDFNRKWIDPDDEDVERVNGVLYATSPDVNKLYYNPTLTYLPGVNADETSFGHADFTAADEFPYRGLDCDDGDDISPDPINLSSQYRAMWRGASRCNNDTFYYIDDEVAVDPNPDAGKAYYHLFDQRLTGCTVTSPDVNTPDECFARIEVGSQTDQDAAKCQGYYVEPRMPAAATPDCVERDNADLSSPDDPGPLDEAALAKRNFANWYVYHRTRFLTTKTALSRVMQELHPSVRFLYQEARYPGGLAPGNSTYDALLERYGPFNDSVRAAFYDDMFGLRASDGSQPYTHSTIVRAGEFVQDELLQRDDLANPSLDAVNRCGIKCRRNFHLLISGGEMIRAECANNQAANCANLDGGSEITTLPDNPYNITSYPSTGDDNRLYRDGNANTLADAAFYYWATDLWPGYDNEVVPLLHDGGEPEYLDAAATTETLRQEFWDPRNDPATWQHLSTYIVSLGSSGDVEPDTDFTDGSYRQYLEDDGSGTPRLVERATGADDWEVSTDGFPGNWYYPLPTAAAPGLFVIPKAIQSDDLWHAALNGRGGFISAQDPKELTDAFEGILATISATADFASSTPAAVNSQSLDSDSRLFQTIIRTEDWSGQILSYLYEVSTGTGGPCPDIPEGQLCTDEPTWDAAEELAAWDARAILTSANGTLTSFDSSTASWEALTSTQQAFLDESPPVGVTAEVYGKLRIDYLRGDSTCEESTDANDDGCEFRDRLRPPTTPLGAVVNSAPIVVGPPSRLYNEGGYQDVDGFRDDHEDRASILYVGGTDGMLHAFNIADGSEVFAYVPELIYPKLADLTDPDYLISKDGMVDGQIAEADAYYGSAWHTVLVAGMGVGAQGLFALDVTTPTATVAGGVATPGISLLWEFSDADGSDSRVEAANGGLLDGRDLGYVYSRPAIVRLDSADDWVVLVPNGYNNTNSVDESQDDCVDDAAAATNCTVSQTGESALYVLNLDPNEPDRIRAVMRTGQGTAQAASVGRDDWTTNGLGPVTAVDSNADLVADFAYAGDLFGNLWKFDLTDPTALGAPTLLFQATINVAGVPTQPITSPVAVARHPTGIGTMVLFGTGKWLGKGDTADKQLQTFYGIWDDGGYVYTDAATRDDLYQQQFLDISVANDAGNISIGRISTDAEDINWAGDGERHRGWYIDLVVADTPVTEGDGERVVSEPQVRSDRVIFVSVIPGDCCEGGGASWVNALDLNDGSRLGDAPFDFNLDGSVDLADLLDASGLDGYTDGSTIAGSSIRLDPNATTTIYSAPSLLMDGNTATNIISDSSGNLIQLRESSALDWRVWRQIR